MTLLKTKRTQLSLLTVSDFEEVLELFLEADMFKYIAPGKNNTKEQHADFLNFKMQEIKEKKGFYWLARTNDTNELIGCLNLTPIKGTDKMQVGWLIGTKFRKQGYAFETAQAILNFAIVYKIFNPIYAVYEAENIASKKIIQKLNFTFLKTTVEDDISVNTYVFNF